MCSDRSKARRFIAARLFLVFLGLVCGGVFLFQGAERAIASLPVSVAVTHLEQPPADRLLPDSAGKMNINSATAEDLQRAYGIGPALAQRILELREARGGFRFLEDVMDVSGIGEKRFQALAELFYCP